MNEDLQKIPAKVPLEKFDISVLPKERLKQLIQGGKFPTADTIVEEILLRTAKLDATDLHIEPIEEGLRVKLGHEGTLRTFVTLPKDIAENITSVFKTRAGLNAFEKKTAQHGRFSVTFGTAEFDFRINTLPLDSGERMALTVTEKSRKVSLLDDLGFTPENLTIVRRLIRKPHGLLVVSGPTGSGKSTTVYAALNELNRAGKNIITVEDPIEYRLDFASQLSVDRGRDLSFSDLVRSILRQRPDVLLCGDLRETEMAVGAVEAALNGILVLATIIATDAVSTIFRLTDLGLPPSKLASCLTGVVHQRLVGRICPKCSQEYEAPDIPPRIAALEPGRRKFRRGAGCVECQDTGYHERIAVREVLVVSDSIQELLFGGASIGRIREAALSEGFVDIQTVTAKRVLDGLSTIDEYMRVSG